MQPGDKVFVAGHRGLVGSAIVRRLRRLGFRNLVIRTRAQLDLCDGIATRAFFEAEQPSYLFIAAAKVGGILANDTSPADFIRENLAIQLSVLEAAHVAKVTKVLFIGSSCTYPKFAPRPIREEALLSGALEPTNEAYAIAKIAGILTCRSYNRQHRRGCPDDSRNRRVFRQHDVRSEQARRHAEEAPRLISVARDRLAADAVAS